MSAIDDFAQALFPVVLRACEVAARMIATVVGVRDPAITRRIQFLVFALVACPIIILGLAALVWSAKTLMHVLAGSV
jgi:hypothetical protein